MAKITIILDTRSIDSKGFSPIKLRIVHGGTNTTISTNIYVPQKVFTGDAERIVNSTYANAKTINAEISTLYYKHQNAILELSATGRIKLMTAADIRMYVENKKDVHSEITFSNEIDKYISQCRAQKTKSLYIYARDMVYEYIKKSNVLFEELNYSTIKSFNIYMTNKGLSTNTRGLIMRNIRTIFNEAIREELISPNIYPFRKFSIEKARKEKDPLTLHEMRKIIYSNAQGCKKRARDLFLLSFMLCGINPCDLYEMPPCKDKIEFVRRKIKFRNPLPNHITIQKEALEIIEQYTGETHLLNFAEKRLNYNTFKQDISRDLRLFGEDIGIKLYFNRARYTWSTFAAHLGVSNDVISKAIGHVDNGVTETHYIDFDWDRVDKANRAVLDYISGNSH